MNVEAELFRARIVRTVDRLVALSVSLTDELVCTPPPIAASNSLAVIVTHVLANLEENVCAVIDGEAVTRFRDDEFTTPIKTAVEIEDAWKTLRPRVEAAIAGLAAEDMAADRNHPRRGAVSVREVLMVVMAHAALHEGHAEVTRDYLLAMGSSPN